MAKSHPPWQLQDMATHLRKNVHKYFPKSEETQQGHMKNQRQGIRSMNNPQSQPSMSHTHGPNYFLKTYDTQNTLYTDQTGKFPHFSSQGNRYQMILYHVATNSIWVEAMRNKTEGELILARACALQRMAACGIKPTKQVLDNEASASYKHAIINSNMSYQLVPPDDHHHNLAKKPSSCGHTTSLQCSMALQTNFHSISHAKPSHKCRTTSISCINHTPTPKSLLMPSSMDIMTTIPCPL